MKKCFKYLKTQILF